MSDLSSAFRVLYNVFAARAISGIGDDRVADVRQMNSNLVCAACADLNIEQCEFIKSLRNFKQRQSRPSRPAFEDSHASAVMRAATDAGVYLSAIFHHATVNERCIKLEDFSITKLIGNFFVRRVGFRYDQKP